MTADAFVGPGGLRGETHFMGLDVVLLRGLVIHSEKVSDLPTGRVITYDS